MRSSRSPASPVGFRLDAAAIGAVADPGATAFVCGSARSTLAMESYLPSAGQPEGSIRVERLSSGSSPAERSRKRLTYE